MDDDEHARVLVDRARSGDDDAARELIRQLYPLVAKIVRGYRPRRTAEEDLAQMIFVKVFQNLAQYSGKVPISHWVSRIAVNTCRNQLMAEKARPELRHADLSEEPCLGQRPLPGSETRRARSGGKVARHVKTSGAAGYRYALSPRTQRGRSAKAHRLDRCHH